MTSTSNYATNTTMFSQRLLISAPNTGGGLAVIENGKVTPIAGGATVGMALTDATIAIARQSRTLYLLNGKRLTGVALGRDADVHNMHVKGQSLYVAITGRNEIIEIDMPTGRQKNAWRFEGEGDSWHINSVGEWRGRMCFSAFGKFPTYRGYKANSEGTGFIGDLLTGEALVSGLSQPHSINVEGEDLWICNSMPQEVLKISDGTRLSSGPLGGYTRGISIARDSVFAGISSLRGDSGAYRSRIVELDKRTLAVKQAIEVPFREVYAIRPLSDEHYRQVMYLIRRAPGYQRNGIRKAFAYLLMHKTSAASSPSQLSAAPFPPDAENIQAKAA